MRATMSTSCGDIEIELDPGIAPETVNSFVFLATEGYLDGTVLHRVIPGFIAQGGDQTATGMGGPGYTAPDEFPPSDMT
ncbi:MAG: peptidylprolyl isomerase, partial [Methylococcales bacterium]|nr:peptidylprolyl isomerase [Methylococcales bacterium]